ncbi:NAD(P)H-hydrate dehydratase [Undibacterium sp. WLHG33]|uniref:NAD(P)H-hydrate dehydratase n=1 Tax=Undibacterium sp. WLHG33 TaxID=3412482 RepID=UPI003C306DCA
MPDYLTLFSSEQIRQLETLGNQRSLGTSLMQKAGKAAADFAMTLSKQTDAPVLIVAGPGNNGGDACETAANLAANGFSVSILLCADPQKYLPEAHFCFEHAITKGAKIIAPEEFLALQNTSWSLIIDGLFGIGLTREITGIYADVIVRLNSLSSKNSILVLALDTPSGLDTDTGVVHGQQHIAIRADYTLTFIGNKPGLHTADGKDYAGKVIVCHLELPEYIYPISSCVLNCPNSFEFVMPERRQNSHKGSYGNVIIIGGADGMTGAGVLAARSALFSGAGKVFIGFIQPIISYDPSYPEIMCRDAKDLEYATGVVVAGPGMGSSEAARDILNAILDAGTPLVLDADALNLIAADNALQKKLSNRTTASVLTPHPLEAARLLGSTVKEIQQNRLSATKQLSSRFNAVVILKGAGSIIASPDGSLRINTSGNPGLATGGTGDVLAGLCGALLAQGFHCFNAAQLATWIHGNAADKLVSKGTGPLGICASELPVEIRNGLNSLVHSRHSQV